MKKITALSLICLLLSGCVQQNSYEKQLDPKNPITLTLWHYYNGIQKTALDNMIDEFNSTVGLEKGIVVEANNVGSILELTDKVKESAAGKVGALAMPEIFTAYADTAYELNEAGTVADLSQYLTSDEINEYVESYVDEGTFNDELKIFPFAKATECLQINKTDWDVFVETSGATLDDLRTVEGLNETAESYYEYTDALTPDIMDDGKPFFGRDAVANYFIIGCRQLGIEIFEVNDDQVTINFDKEIIRKIWDNYYVPYVKGYYLDKGRFRSDDVKTGDIIAFVGSTSSIPYFPTQVIEDDNTSYDIDVIFQEIPVFQGGTHVAVQQGAGMVVAKKGEVKEYASVLFLKWFTETERNIEFTVNSAYLPVKKEANDLMLIESMIDKNNIEMDDDIKVGMEVAVNTVNNYELFTSKAFYHGTDARTLLQSSLVDDAKAARQQVLDLMASGSSREDALSQLINDQIFDAWYEKLKTDLDELV